MSLLQGKLLPTGGLYQKTKVGNDKMLQIKAFRKTAAAPNQLKNANVSATQYLLVCQRHLLSKSNDYIIDKSVEGVIRS